MKSTALIVVLVHTGRNREDVRIENDVLRREADRVREQVIGALADFHLALQRVGLAAFVEGHHHDRGAVAADEFRLLDDFASPSLSEWSSRCLCPGHISGPPR